MNKINLSAAQKALCEEFKNSSTERPSFEEYQNFQKKMRLIEKVLEKPNRKLIPKTTLGYDPNEVKLLPGFNALIHLPEGWAVYPCYDSGDNYRIVKAGSLTLANIWKSWKSE